MSLNLEEINGHITARLALDTKLAAVPYLTQIAADTDGQEAADAYNKALNDALENTGVAFVAVVADGELAANESVPALDLNNMVVLSIIENPKKNNTGLTAYQYLRRAMLVLHRAADSVTARAGTRLAKNAYQLGPLGTGKVVYFLNLLVRTTEKLGPIDPVTP